MIVPILVAATAATHPCPRYYAPAQVENNARHTFHHRPTHVGLRRLGEQEACLTIPGLRGRVVRFDHNQAALRRRRLARAAARARAAAAAYAHQQALRAAASRATVHSTPTPSPSPAPRSVPTASATGGYVIPSSVVQCESGGNAHAVSPFTGGGLYGILSSSWAAFGGLQFAPEPYDATPAQQGIVAQRILASQGPSAWQCWH